MVLRRLPVIGLGTSPGRPWQRPLDFEPAIRAGLEAGYPLIDTAEVYGTEKIVGGILRALGSARREISVTSKLWQTEHAPEGVAGACRRSLHRLGLERLDFYLVHSPESWRSIGPIEVEADWSLEEIRRRVVPRNGNGEINGLEVPLDETWEAMLELKDAGLVAEVGVANFERVHLELLAAKNLRFPAVNQIALDPRRPRHELVAFCHSQGIEVMAHTPFGGGRILTHPELAQLAQRVGEPPANLVLRWHLSRDLIPIPGSRVPEHVCENLRVLHTPTRDQVIENLESIDWEGSPFGMTE